MLGMSSSEYNLFLNFNDFWNYATPLLGAFIADAFLGRYKTIAYAAPIYIGGLTLLVVSSTPLGYGDFPYYPSENGGWALYGFWVAVTIMGLGCGLIKPCVSVFAAEQLKDEYGNDASPRTLEKLYLWWYMAINVGSFVGPLAGPLLSGGTQDGLDNLLGYQKFQCTGNATIIPACEGYCPGGCISTPPTEVQAAECCNGNRVALNYWLVWGCWSLPMLVIAFAIFFVGGWRPGYICAPPGGSYLGDFFRCMWGAITCRSNDRKPDGKPIRCFEKLKGLPGMPSDRTIDEFRMMLITTSIFIPFSLFFFCNSQMYSWGYNQCDPALRIAGWMDCNQMQNTNPFFILISIPILDFIVYPFFIRMRWHITHVHKIGMGMIIMGLALVIMGGIQTYINSKGYYKVSVRCLISILPIALVLLTSFREQTDDSSSYVYNNPANYKEEQLSVYWQLIIFGLSGIAEVVGNIAVLELAYVGSPPSMKSLVMAFALMTTCGGAIIGFIVNPFFTMSNAVYYMYISGGVCMLFGPGMWWVFGKMKTGRDLMPELFEANITDVAKTGGNKGIEAVESSINSMGSIGSNPLAQIEMGSKHAMDAIQETK